MAYTIVLVSMIPDTEMGCEKYLAASSSKLFSADRAEVFSAMAELRVSPCPVLWLYAGL